MVNPHSPSPRRARGSLLLPVCLVLCISTSASSVGCSAVQTVSGDVSLSSVSHSSTYSTQGCLIAHWKHNHNSLGFKTGVWRRDCPVGLSFLTRIWWFVPMHSVRTELIPASVLIACLVVRQHPLPLYVWLGQRAVLWEYSRSSILVCPVSLEMLSGTVGDMASWTYTKPQSRKFRNLEHAASTR